MKNKFIKIRLILFALPFLWISVVNAKWAESSRFTEYDIASISKLISTVVTATNDRAYKKHSIPIINTYRFKQDDKKSQLVRCFSYFNAETSYNQRCEFLFRD